MDWYIVAKFLHIVSAIMWLGGGFSLTMLAMRADRANDDADLIKVIQQVVYLSPRVIVPASAATLVFGVIMVWLGQSFSDLWIVLGLAGFALTFGFGVGVIKPATEKMAEAIARDGLTEEVLVRARKLIQHVKCDMVLLYTIVADMVLKPTMDDVAVLTAMAAVLAVAAFLFLGAGRRPVVARA